MTTGLRSHFLRFVLVLCLFQSSKADWLQDLQSGRTVTVGDGVKVRVDKINDGVNQTSYFSSHVLRVFVGDAGLSLAKAKGREGLQIGLFTPNADGSSEARGSDANVFSVVLPLLIGFKIAGSILTTLVAVLVVSLKAFLASKLSLLLTGAGALKKMMGHGIPAEVHYPMPMEYYPHHPPTGYEYPSAQGYNAPAHSAPGHTAPAHSAPSAPGAGDHEHHGPTATASDSNTVSQYVAANASAAPTQHQAVQGVRRRVYKRRNPNVVPVITVAKITRKEAL